MGDSPEKVAQTFIERTPQATGESGHVLGSLSDLASQLDRGLEIVKKREQILDTVRKAAIKLTFPEDWVLQKDRVGNEIAFLQDGGCDRVRDLAGIEVYNVTTPEKVTDEDGTFTYVQYGDGRCLMTQQTVEKMIGARSSNEDFCSGKNGARLVTDVMKATRANLDGSITRELAGLKSVPVQVLKSILGADEETYKRFRKGHGYGKQEERTTQGEKAPEEIEIPKCPKCQVPMVRRKGSGAKGPYDFFGCTNFKSKDCKESIDTAEWLATLEKRKAEKKEATSTPADQTDEIPEQIKEFSDTVAAIINADPTQTPDGLSKRFLQLKGDKDGETKPVPYKDAITFRRQNLLNWIHGSTKKMRKAFENILPPEEKKPEPEPQEQLPL